MIPIPASIIRGIGIMSPYLLDFSFYRTNQESDASTRCRLWGGSKKQRDLTSRTLRFR
jgi:hypothetical protein